MGDGTALPWVVSTRHLGKGLASLSGVCWDGMLGMAMFGTVGLRAWKPGSIVCCPPQLGGEIVGHSPQSPWAVAGVLALVQRKGFPSFEAQGATNIVQWRLPVPMKDTPAGIVVGLEVGRPGGPKKPAVWNCSNARVP